MDEEIFQLRATSGPNHEPEESKCCINRMSERETVVELPFAAGCCPCVGKLQVKGVVRVQISGAEISPAYSPPHMHEPHLEPKSRAQDVHITPHQSRRR